MCVYIFFSLDVLSTRNLETFFEGDLFQILQSALGIVGLSPSKKRIVKILQDVTGIIRPSRFAYAVNC